MNVGAQCNQKIPHPFHQTYQKIIASAVQKKIVVQIPFQPIPHRMIDRKIEKRGQGCNKYAANYPKDAFPDLFETLCPDCVIQEKGIPTDKKSDQRELTPENNSRHHPDKKIIDQPESVAADPFQRQIYNP